MNKKLHISVLAAAFLLTGGCAATCGPGTIETDGGGWRVDHDSASLFTKVCLPVSPISDCTDFQMIEEDGGGWRNDRDGGGWRVDHDGGGWRVDHDGSGWRKERDVPHHPADAGNNLEKVVYVPAGVCRVGVEAPALAAAP